MRARKRQIVFLIIPVFAILGLAVFFWIKREVAPAALQPLERAAPEVKGLKDYEGREVKLSDFRGKFVMVNTWASWCPFCLKELPDFAVVQEEVKDKIVIIAINRGESEETAKKYSEAQGITEKFILLLDPSDSFYAAIGGFSMPETIFLNELGIIIFHKRGPMAIGEMRERVHNAFDL